MNVLWRDNQDLQLPNIRQRIDFVALVYAERSPAQQEKRHVRAEGYGNFQQSSAGKFLFCEPQIAQQGCRGVARSSAEASARRECFLERDLHRAVDIQFASPCI